MQIVRIIQEVAERIVTSSSGSKPINGGKELRDALCSAGHSELRSAELAEKWGDRLRDEVGNCLTEWEKLGLPQPLIESEIRLTFLPYGHARYQALAKSPKMTLAYAEACQFIDALSRTDFLLVPLCLLQLAGCDPILITDGKGDLGVDCIGSIKTGPTRSLTIFAQAKTSNTQIAPETIRVDFDKFRTLQKKPQFGDYLMAVGANTSLDGRAVCYGFFSNTEFSNSAREYGREEGILLRSRKQAAYWLSQGFGVSGLRKLRDEIGLTLKRDLSRNVAPMIAQHRSTNAG